MQHSYICCPIVSAILRFGGERMPSPDLWRDFSGYGRRYAFYVISCDKFAHVWKNLSEISEPLYDKFYIGDGEIVNNFYLKREIDDDGGGGGDLVTINIKVFETTNIDELILIWRLSTWTAFRIWFNRLLIMLRLCVCVWMLANPLRRFGRACNEIAERLLFLLLTLLLLLFVLFAHFTQRHGHCAAASIFSVWLLSSTTDWAMHSPRKIHLRVWLSVFTDLHPLPYSLTHTHTPTWNRK